jgi:hypothetical protein
MKHDSVRIPVFSGRPSENPRDWMERYEKIALFKQWDDPPVGRPRFPGRGNRLVSNSFGCLSFRVVRTVGNLNGFIATKWNTSDRPDSSPRR